MCFGAPRQWEVSSYCRHRIAGMPFQVPTRHGQAGVYRISEEQFGKISKPKTLILLQDASHRSPAGTLPAVLAPTEHIGLEAC